MQQAADEQKARRQGVRHNYDARMCQQTFGPFPRIVVPHNHSRLSRYTAFSNVLADPNHAIDASFQVLEAALEPSNTDLPNEVVPLVLSTAAVDTTHEFNVSLPVLS